MKELDALVEWWKTPPPPMKRLVKKLSRYPLDLVERMLERISDDAKAERFLAARIFPLPGDFIKYIRDELQERRDHLSELRKIKAWLEFQARLAEQEAARRAAQQPKALPGSGSSVSLLTTVPRTLPAVRLADVSGPPNMARPRIVILRIPVADLPAAIREDIESVVGEVAQTAMLVAGVTRLAARAGMVHGLVAGMMGLAEGEARIRVVDEDAEAALRELLVDSTVP
jgi:hypothetical protein